MTHFKKLSFCSDRERYERERYESFPFLKKKVMKIFMLFMKAHNYKTFLAMFMEGCSTWKFQESNHIHFP